MLGKQYCGGISGVYEWDFGCSLYPAGWKDFSGLFAQVSSAQSPSPFLFSFTFTWSGLFGNFLISYYLFLLELTVNYSPIHFLTYFKLSQTPRTDLFEAQLYFSTRNPILNKQSVMTVSCKCRSTKNSYTIIWKAISLLMINHLNTCLPSWID